jgi:hypothetical protein
VNEFDRGKKRLIWRGDASKTVDLKKDLDKNYANMQRLWPNFLGIVRLILNKWSVGPRDSPCSARKPGQARSLGGWNKILPRKSPSRV